MDKDVENKYPSMDVTYEWGRTSPERLSDEASSLDSKIIGLFAVASIIIGVASTFTKAIKLDWTLTPFAIAVVSFLIVFVKSFWALRAFEFQVADCPQILKEDWWPLEPSVAKVKYWEHVQTAFEQNYKCVKAKGRTLRLIIPLVALEVIALVMWLFLLRGF
jgi:hypothetical protein